MLEFNPQVMRRMWMLRQFPMFAAAELGELALLAENVAEITYPAGAAIAKAGKRPTVLHLVVEGEVALATRAWGTREIFGMLEALAGRELAAPAIATRPTRTLRLHAVDLADVLEDSFTVTRATLHELATRIAAGSPPRPRSITLPDSDPFGLVDRLLVLRQLVPLAGGHLDALAALAHASQEITYPAGTVLGRAGDPASACRVIVAGQISAKHPERPALVLGPGSALTGLEALGDLPQRYTVETLTPVRVLEASTTAIFDVLEDHPELALAVLAGFASVLLDAAISIANS